jgi:hypothetical protein
MNQGCVSVMTGKTSEAIEMITSGITALRSTRTTLWQPLHLPERHPSVKPLRPLKDRRGSKDEKQQADDIRL